MEWTFNMYARDFINVLDSKWHDPSQVGYGLASLVVFHPLDYSSINPEVRLLRSSPVKNNNLAFVYCDGKMDAVISKGKSKKMIPVSVDLESENPVGDFLKKLMNIEYC